MVLVLMDMVIFVRAKFYSKLFPKFKLPQKKFITKFAPLLIFINIGLSDCSEIDVIVFSSQMLFKTWFSYCQEP